MHETACEQNYVGIVEHDEQVELAALSPSNQKFLLQVVVCRQVPRIHNRRFCLQGWFYAMYAFAGTDTRGSAIWQRNSALASLLQKLAQVVDSGKMATVICPRPALVSEKYMGTRMRMWGAISQRKVRFFTLLHHTDQSLRTLSCVLVIDALLDSRNLLHFDQSLVTPPLLRSTLI